MAEAWRYEIPQPDWATDDDGECIECPCADEAPRDPNDPGAYPGPDPYCECICHG